VTRRLSLVLTVGLGIACRDPAPAGVPPIPSAANTAAKTTAAPSPEPAPQEAAEPSAALPPCTRDAVPLNLQGLGRSEVEARFGPPTTREQFRAEERQGEFYSGIETVYPSTDPKNRDVPLEEWTWRSGDCTLTVWFHQQGGAWRVIDDVYWHKSIDF